MRKLLGLILSLASLGYSASPTILRDIAINDADFAAQAVPTTLTTIFSQTIWLDEGGWVYNGTGADITLTLQTLEGTPTVVFNEPVKAHTKYWFNGYHHSRMQSGLAWQASATGLVGYFRGKM